MPDETRVSLPPDVAAMLRNVEEINEKRNAGLALGMDDNQLAAFDALLAELKPAVINALLQDAKREKDAAKAAAEKVAEGAPEKPTRPEPNADQKQIKQHEDEIKRIEDKLAKAAELGGSDLQIRQARDRLPGLKEELADAAIDAAEREIDALREAIERLQRGEPQPDPGKGNGPGPTPTPTPAPTPTPTPTPTGGGGGGAPVPGDGDRDGDVVGQSRTTEKAQDAVTIFVRGARTVWAWHRGRGEWVPHAFASDIVEVKLIGGGIFAIAENEAVLWDTYFGRWLAPLASPAETLVEGKASTESG